MHWNESEEWGAFLNRFAEDDSDYARLIAADWLEDTGAIYFEEGKKSALARAALMRWQCEPENTVIKRGKRQMLILFRYFPGVMNQRLFTDSPIALLKHVDDGKSSNSFNVSTTWKDLPDNWPDIYLDPYLGSAGYLCLDRGVIRQIEFVPWRWRMDAVNYLTKTELISRWLICGVNPHLRWPEYYHYWSPGPPTFQDTVAPAEHGVSEDFLIRAWLSDLAQYISPNHQESDQIFVMLQKIFRDGKMDELIELLFCQVRNRIPLSIFLKSNNPFQTGPTAPPMEAECYRVLSQTTYRCVRHWNKIGGVTPRVKLCKNSGPARYHSDLMGRGSDLVLDGRPEGLPV